MCVCRGWKWECTRVLHAVVVGHVTTRPGEDGVLLPSEQFPMTNLSFRRPQMWLKFDFSYPIYLNPRLFRGRRRRRQS